jgi:hypothetical protein
MRYETISSGGRTRSGTDCSVIFSDTSGLMCGTIVGCTFCNAEYFLILAA